MASIIRTETIGWWCPNCKHKTAGLTKNGKTVCPLCKRELWQCEHCGQYTFGTLKDVGQCHNCGHKNY